MPVLLKIEDGKPATFATPLAAVTHLLRFHCTAGEIQNLRLDLGRTILNTLEVSEHVTDSRGTTRDHAADSPATTARKARDAADAKRGDGGANGTLPGE